MIPHIFNIFLVLGKYSEHLKISKSICSYILIYSYIFISVAFCKNISLCFIYIYLNLITQTVAFLEENMLHADTQHFVRPMQALWRLMMKF